VSAPPVYRWPAATSVVAYMTEVLERRDLLKMLAARSLKLRYKQASLGVAWVVLQPLLATAAFSFFFRRLAAEDLAAVPYPLFAFSGLLAWQLFSRIVSEATDSLVGNQTLITKVYFPRAVLPLAECLAGLVDFAIALVVYFVVQALYGRAPDPRTLVLLPLGVALVGATSLGIGLGFAALNVRYRDVRLAIPFLLQLIFFASPVIYPSTVVPGAWRLVHAVNPLVGAIDAFRWSLLGGGALDPRTIAVSCASAVLSVLAGLAYFRSMERSFADTV
jgi:lipopolysaccharide transport system permease protein